MGAWGIETFENDQACDWIWDLEKTSGTFLLEATLLLSEEDYLESNDGCNVLAAAEVVLALNGRPRDGFPDDAAAWVARNSTLDATSLVKLAITSLDKVLSEKSELKTLWEETDRYSEWENDVLTLQALLQK